MQIKILMNRDKRVTIIFYQKPIKLCTMKLEFIKTIQLHN